jgi:hypothetical protein
MYDLVELGSLPFILVDYLLAFSNPVAYVDFGSDIGGDTCLDFLDLLVGPPQTFRLVVMIEFSLGYNRRRIRLLDCLGSKGLGKAGATLVQLIILFGRKVTYFLDMLEIN